MQSHFAMRLYSRLKPTVLLLLVTCSFSSDATGQQVISEGNVIVNGQQAPADFDPQAFVGDIQIGGPLLFLNGSASGRVTVNEGAFLDANFIVIGSEQSTGVFEARGIGTSVTSQDIGLISGSFSVTEGASVSSSFLGTSNITPFAPTISVSGLGSLLTINSSSLDRGTLNISDAGTFSASSLNLGNNGFPTSARLNLTDGAQAVIGELDFGFGGPRRSEVSIGDNSVLSVFSGFAIDGNNTITLEGGILLIVDQGIDIFESGELRGYGDVIGEIQLDGLPQQDQRVTVSADQTLRTSGIRNFTGQITNFGTLDAGDNTIENGFDGRYLGENSTIRADTLVNQGTINLSNGRNFVEAVLDNRGSFNISGGASVIFTNEFFNNGVVFTGAGSTSTILGRLIGPGVFEGEGDVIVLGPFVPGINPGLVSFEGDLALGAAATTEIELGGTLRSTAMQESPIGRYDAVDVGGTLTLGGELNIALVNGFNIESGQEFVIAEVEDSLVGQFTGLYEGAMVDNFGGTELFISYVAGDGNDVALFTAAVSEILLGDANQDGVVDFSDIPAFIAILSAGDFLDEADVNQDGTVDFSDIPRFVEILSAS